MNDNPLCRRSLGLKIFMLLAASACHQTSLPSPDISPVPTGLSLSAPVHLLWPVAFASEPATAAQRLVSQLEQDAARPTPSPDITPPEQGPGPAPVTALPPLAFVSHLSSYLHVSPAGEQTAEQYIFTPLSTTPSSPTLFDVGDPSGQGLGLDMGLTALALPAEGAVEWDVAVRLTVSALMRLACIKSLMVGPGWISIPADSAFPPVFLMRRHCAP